MRRKWMVIVLSIAMGLRCLTATEPEELLQILERCVDPGGPNCDTRVWGPVNTEANPWLLSAELGWMYLHPDSVAEAYYLWIENLGWIFSSQGRFPTAFHYATSSWIMLDLTEKVRIKYWDISARKWEYLLRADRSEIRYSDVPDDIKGLRSETQLGPAPVGGSYVRIGSPFMEIGSWNSIYSGIHWIYIYNQIDGWFYPMESQQYAWNPPPEYEGRTVIGLKSRVSVRVEGENLILTEDNYPYGGELIETIHPITN